MRDKIKAAWAALVAKRTIAGWLLFLGSGILLLSDKWDSLNSLLNKIVALNEMGLLASIIEAARSPALQLALFLAGCLWIGIAVIIGLKRHAPHAQPALTHAISANVPAQIWDETLDLWKEATALINRWVASMRNENQDPPSDDTLTWVTRFESFARNNFSLEQIKIVFEPFQFMVPNDLPSRMKIMPESVEAWKKLRIYEGHLQSFMRDDLRRREPIPPTPRPHQSFKQRLEDQTIVLPSSPIKEGFRIDALPPVPNTVNMTQHMSHEGAKALFTGDAVLGVTNQLPAQVIDLVHFRLLNISPPMKSVKVWKPSTLDAVLKRVDFSEDIPATVVAGKTNEVRLFKATRPFSANSLKDIKVEFYGRWPEGHYPVFNPSERHLLVVEVTGSGVSRTEDTFTLVFSTDKTKPVFTLTKVRRYENRDERASRTLLLAVVDKLKAGVKPLKALQDAKADELETNDMLIALCDDLVKFGHPHPFETLEGIILQDKWLGFLVAARYQGIDLSDELRLLDLLVEKSPTVKPLS